MRSIIEEFLDASPLLTMPIGWSLLVVYGGLAAALIGLRLGLGRRPPASPRCAACGHEASMSGSRCAECGAALDADGALRWDRRPTARRRVVGGCLWVTLLLLSCAHCSVVTLRVFERLGSESAAGLDSAESVERLVERAFGSGHPTDSLTKLVTWAAADATAAAIRAAIVRDLENAQVRDWGTTDLRLFGSLIDALARSAHSGIFGEAPDPELAEMLLRMVAAAAPRIRTRHRVGDVVTVFAPSLPTPRTLEVTVIADRVALDGLPIDHTPPRGPGPLREVRSAEPWILLPVPERPGVRRLRIEYRVRFRPSGAHGSAEPLHELALVHDATVEFVPRTQPIALPTRADELWPWGDLHPRWRLEVVPLGTRQAIALLVIVPVSPSVLVHGRWSVEQDGRAVQLGDSLSTFHASGANRTRWSGAAMLDEPLDLARPFTVRFEPDSTTLQFMAPVDFIWDAPLKIVVTPERAQGRRGGASSRRKVWLDIAPPRPQRAE